LKKVLNYFPPTTSQQHTCVYLIVVRIMI